MTNYSCIFPSRGMHVLSGKSRIALSKMYANFKKGYKAGLLILHYYLKHENTDNKGHMRRHKQRRHRNSNPNLGTNPYTNSNLKLQTGGLSVDFCNRTLCDILYTSIMCINSISDNVSDIVG